MITFLVHTLLSSCCSTEVSCHSAPECADKKFWVDVARSPSLSPHSSPVAPTCHLNIPPSEGTRDRSPFYICSVHLKLQACQGTPWLKLKLFSFTFNLTSNPPGLSSSMVSFPFFFFLTLDHLVNADPKIALYHLPVGSCPPWSFTRDCGGSLSRSAKPPELHR